MKRIYHLLVGAFMYVGVVLSAQSLEVAGGANYNSSYKLKRDDPNNSSSFSTGAGYGI
ncbi:MAG: hypothetical protein ACI9RU_001722 [Litorivivens sp.]|jgi:hypothetical protein